MPNMSLIQYDILWILMVRPKRYGDGARFEEYLALFAVDFIQTDSKRPFCDLKLILEHPNPRTFEEFPLFFSVFVG